jgi:HPt (histidine-containing phosphotransfer) domain-containing protein
MIKGGVSMDPGEAIEAVENRGFPQLEFTDGEGNARLRRLTGGDERFLGRLMEAFLSDMAEKLADLWRDLERGDRASARRRAGAMRSSANIVAADRFAGLCGRLEAAQEYAFEDLLTGLEGELSRVEKGVMRAFQGRGADLEKTGRGRPLPSVEGAGP